jgi:ribonucleotide reductase beta subunit family protein with ferritin-like domain
METKSVITSVIESDVNMNKYENITDPRHSRMVAKPIDPAFREFWDLYKKQQELYWNAEEVKYTNKDIEDFESLKPEEQMFLKQILAFFASSDGIVNYNLRERFLKEFTPYEIQSAYTWQMMMENIHGEVYSDLIINIIKDEKDRNQLLNSFKEFGPVKKMMDWALKWIHSQESVGVRIIAFAIVEGIFFSGMFASIFWLKKQRSGGTSFLEAIVKSNKFISRDEGLHVEFACTLYKHVVNKIPSNIVHNMIREANNISVEFMKESIKCDMIGMNSALMSQYINYVSDRLLIMLGYDKVYNSTNPFDFMDTISLHNEKNKNDREFVVKDDF